MKMCLDFGNSQLYGGLYKDKSMVVSFRKSMNKGISSDEMGIFLKSVIKENGFQPEEIKSINFCSVVPEFNHSIKNSCMNYFGITPLALEPGVKTGLQIKYINQSEVGADRIANAIAACELHPNRDIIVVDMGTATTFDVVTKNKEYLGGAIIPGISIGMESLVQRTAKLPMVEIIKPKDVCGKSTVQSIQSGLYFGNLGAIKEICREITESCFDGNKVFVLGTGGISGLYDELGVFDEINKDLVLEGLIKLEELNKC